jgi:predicted LPLAT superfamily acyltransferase
MTTLHPDRPTPTPPQQRPAAARAADWAERGIGPGWKHKFFYGLMRIGGKARGYHMANIASLWYVLFYPSIRQRCRFYLDRRFPGRRGAMQKLLDTYRLVRNYATTLVDMMVLSMFGRQAFKASCPDHDRLIEITAGGRGFVLIHGHVGCWQVGMSTLGQLGRKVAIVMLPEPQMVSLLGPQADGAIDPRGGLQASMQITDALLRGDIVAMMGDRTFGSDQTVVTASFLGGRVQLPTSPYRMASATGVPVVVMIAPRIGRGSYQLRLAKVIEVPPGLGRNSARYAPYAQQFADCMEQFVQEYPWQFYNFYDLWRDANALPAAPASATPVRD